MPTEPAIVRAAAAEQTTVQRQHRRSDPLYEAPPTVELRAELRRHARRTAEKLDKSMPLSKAKLGPIARRLLAERQQPEGYLGWMTVTLASEFWRDQVAATPPERRLLLLPRELSGSQLAAFRTQAENLGYRVLTAEKPLKVMKMIVSGAVDAIVGVARLNVLEKAINKALAAGIPCMAAPLLSNDGREAAVDGAWLSEIINVREAATAQQTNTYLHLLRTAQQLFEHDEMERLSPRVRKGPTLGELNGEGIAGLDPVAGTEAIAYDFLARGGKYARPFITLAVYDALTGSSATGESATGSEATGADCAETVSAIPDTVRRVAMSIETFHKASLVHDDIEDDDDHRYGEPTLHRRYGTATAINVGDYLIGLGYRLVSRQSAELGGEMCAELLDRLADAHLRLSEGQGAELLWRDSRDKQLTPRDALNIYALKTAPAFEAALLCGVRCAGRGEDYERPLKQLAKYLGVAFQVLNDLKDWQGDDDNKLAAGLDALGGRPTLLWALALEALEGEARREMLALAANDNLDQSTRVVRIRQLYQQAGVFEKAHRLVEEYQSRAEQLAAEIQPASFRRLLYYLIDTILEQPAEVEASPETLNADSN